MPPAPYMCACVDLCVSVVAAEQNVGQWFSTSSDEPSAPCCAAKRAEFSSEIYRNLISGLLLLKDRGMALLSFFHDMFMGLTPTVTNSLTSNHSCGNLPTSTHKCQKKNIYIKKLKKSASGDKS